MKIAWPLALIALIIVPLALLGYLALERRRARYAVHYTNIEVLATIASVAPRWRRYLPLALAALALTCAVAALARPQVEVSVASEQASIALAVDISGSMAAEDIKPTRLGAAQEAVRRFLKELPDKYRVGLVTFSSEPYVSSPLTHDRQHIVDGIRFGTAFGRGTAIGDALGRSVELLQPLAAESEGSSSGGAPLPAARPRPAGRRPSCCSPTALRRAARSPRCRARSAPSRTASPSTRSRWARRTA